MEERYKEIFTQEGLSFSFGGPISVLTMNILKE